MALLAIERFLLIKPGSRSHADRAARGSDHRKKKRRLAEQTVASLSAQGPDLDCSRLAVMNANNDPLGVRSADPFPGADAEGRPFGFRQSPNRLSPSSRSESV